MRSRRRLARLLLRLCLVLLVGLFVLVVGADGDDVQDEESSAVTGRMRAVKARERRNWGIIGKIITAYYSLRVVVSLWRCVMKRLKEWVSQLSYTAERKDGMVDSYWEFSAWRAEGSFILDLISPKLEQASCLARLGC